LVIFIFTRRLRSRHTYEGDVFIEKGGRHVYQKAIDSAAKEEEEEGLSAYIAFRGKDSLFYFSLPFG